MRLFLLAALALTGCATTYNATWREPITVAALSEPGRAADAEGDVLWKDRGNKTSLTSAIDKWESTGSTDPVVLAKVARARALLADVFDLEGDLDRRDSQTRLGLDVATQAVKGAAPEFASALAEGRTMRLTADMIPSEAVPAVYWFAVHLERWASAQGVGTRLRYREDVQALMERVEALDEAYFYGGPLRHRGMLEALTEGRGGGTWAASEAAFQKAVTLGPAFLGNKVEWAATLCVQREDRDCFSRLLNEVIAADAAATPALAAENAIEQAKARKLLSRAESLF